jgi:hypothetical protein
MIVWDSLVKDRNGRFRARSGGLILVKAGVLQAYCRSIAGVLQEYCRVSQEYSKEHRRGLWGPIHIIITLFIVCCKYKLICLLDDSVFLVPISMY